MALMIEDWLSLLGLGLIGLSLLTHMSVSGLMTAELVEKLRAAMTMRKALFSAAYAAAAFLLVFAPPGVGWIVGLVLVSVQVIAFSAGPRQLLELGAPPAAAQRVVAAQFFGLLGFSLYTAGVFLGFYLLTFVARAS